MKKLLNLSLTLMMLLFIFGVSTTVFAASTINESEDNGSYATADKVTAGSTVRGMLSSADDYDYYKFVAPSDGKLSVDFCHTYEDNGDGWEIAIYRYEGGEYYWISGSTVALNDNEKITVPFAGTVEDSVYYVRVDAREHYNPSAVDHSYQLKINFTQSNYYEKEENGSYATATKVSANNTYNGVLNNSDDYDYYKFVAPSNGKLSVDFSHSFDYSSDGWDIQIYRYANGEYVWITGSNVSLEGNEKITVPFVGVVKDGIYYITVDAREHYNPGAVGHDYKLTFNFTKSNYCEKEVNNSYSAATKVSANKTYTGVLNDSDDYDYYKFVAPSNGNLKIDFCHQYVDNGDGWDIRVYRYVNGEYSEISNCSVALNDVKEITVPFVGAVKNGIYYITVDAREHYNPGAVGHNYKLVFNFTESDNCEKEVNDSYATATRTYAGNTYTGVLNYSDDYDYYKFIAPSNGTLKINFCHKYVDNGDGWDIRVYRYANGEYSEISCYSVALNDVKDISVFSNNVLKNGIYYISVDAREHYNAGAVGNNYQLKIKFTLSPISSLKATPTTSSIKLSWSKVNNADGYQIQQYKNKKWSTLTKTDSTSYTVKNLSKATSYKFRVRAYATASGKTYYSAWKTVSTATKPGSTTLKATAGTRKVTLSWNKVTGADGYVIYRATSKNGTYKKVTTAKSTTTKYTNTGLSAGKMYYYKIRAYVKTDNGYVYGAYSAVKSARPTLAAPTLKLTAGTKKVTLSWGKVTGASGYVIYRSTSKNGTYSKVATVKSGSTTQYTNKNLTAKKTYYYKIRAYVKVGDTYYYSPYSSVKSVKTK